MKKSDYSLEEFWKGFAQGNIVGLAFLYLFGTTKGRSFVKDMLHYSEDVDLTPELIEKILNTVTESEKPNAQLQTNSN